MIRICCVAAALWWGFGGLQPVAALSLSIGDTFSGTATLPSDPPSNIAFIDIAFEFAGDGLVLGDQLSLSLRNTGGQTVFNTVIDVNDGTGGEVVLPDGAGGFTVVGLLSAFKEVEVDPARVTGTELDFSLDIIAGSVGLSSLSLSFVEGEPVTGSGSGTSSPLPGSPRSPFTRKPGPALVWETGTTPTPIPLPAAGWFLLSVVGALGIAKRTKHVV